MKKPLLLLILSFSFLFNQAQYNDDMPDLLTAGAGVSFANFIGDLDTEASVSKFANIKTVFNFNLERRFGEIFGVQLEGLYGKLSFNERTKFIDQNRNFTTPLIQVGANFIFHFDNDLVINKNSPFSPYFAVGAHFLMFDPHGDLEDKNGVKYNYWDDGTIRDIPQGNLTHGDTIMSTQIRRDYTYETKLTDDNENYSRGALTVPLTFGLKWKFTPRVQGRVFGTYNLIMSDWVDNVKENGNNDQYVSVGFSLHYVIRKVNQEKKHRYDDVDFTTIDNSDRDGDGVRDIDDFCQNTPKNIEVDGKGCPLDKDKDGIPDYLDEEPKTPKGAVVDEQGRELTDKLLAERLEDKEKLVEQRRQVFSDDASFASLSKISKDIEEEKAKSNSIKRNVIPERLREADADNNGMITSAEILGAMDGFFEGSNNFTVGSLNDLIDYFFEQ